MSTVPPPLIEIAVEPKAKGDREKMGQALARLAAEDPSLRVTFDHESGQTIIKGMSEPHLEAMVERLRGEFAVEINIGAPQVAYRETIRRQALVDYTHEKLPGEPRQSAPANVIPISPGASFTFENEPVASGPAQYARILMTLEPLPPGSGFVFANEMADGVVPEEYLPSVEKGVTGSLDHGVLAGFPVVDLKVTLTGCAYRAQESSALAFELAARGAMKEGLTRAAPTLLEPIMKVEVATPRDYMGDVIGDLNSRRGRITGQDQRGNAEVIIALVPLANLFGYACAMATLSQGRITFTMAFTHYERALKPSDDGDDPPFGPAIGMRA